MATRDHTADGDEITPAPRTLTIGLVAPQRGPNGYRHFSPADVHRLRFLSRARRLDFSLQDCRDLLMLNEDTSRSSADVREIAARHLAQVDERLADLMQLRTALQQLVQSCAGDGHPDCSILDALAGDCTLRDRG